MSLHKTATLTLGWMLAVATSHATPNLWMERDADGQLLNRVLGDIELTPIPLEYPLFSSFYQIERLPKIVDLYQGPPMAFGGWIDGRLAVVYTYDTDIPCGWEKNPDGSFVHVLAPDKHERSIRFGINVLHYALQQRLAPPTGEQP